MKVHIARALAAMLASTMMLCATACSEFDELLPMDNPAIGTYVGDNGNYLTLLDNRTADYFDYRDGEVQRGNSWTYDEGTITVTLEQLGATITADLPSDGNIFDFVKVEGDWEDELFEKVTSDSEALSASDYAELTGQQIQTTKVTPEVFGDVAIADWIWGDDNSIYINRGKTDYEDDSPYITVTSDDQGTIRSLYIFRGGYGSASSVDAALNTVREYVDLEYLQSHYEYYFSYCLENTTSRTEDYVIVYNPVGDEEQCGQLQVSMFIVDGVFYSISVYNECMARPDDMEWVTPETIQNGLSNFHHWIDWTGEL